MMASFGCATHTRTHSELVVKSESQQNGQSTAYRMVSTPARAGASQEALEARGAEGEAAGSRRHTQPGCLFLI